MVSGDDLFQDNPILRSTVSGSRRLLAQPRTQLPLLWISFVIFLGLAGPHVAPYQFDETLYTDGGGIKVAQQPSFEHPLGTTGNGYDVLSRIIIGARPTALTGLLGGILIVGIGLSVALTAGYVGGWVDELLMRVTDVFYSVPLIPFAVVVLGFLGGGFFTALFVIGILLWRGNARVIRSQVLQIKERPYVRAAKALGANRRQIILKHILPNVAPMATLFFAFGIGFSIIAQAGLAFIGVSDPFQPSWGVVIRNAFNSGYMTEQWVWAAAPGVMIAFTVLSAFMLGREFETRGDEQVGGRG